MITWENYKYPFLSYLLLLKKKGCARQVWQLLSQWLFSSLTYRRLIKYYTVIYEAYKYIYGYPYFYPDHFYPGLRNTWRRGLKDLVKLWWTDRVEECKYNSNVHLTASLIFSPVGSVFNVRHCPLCTIWSRIRKLHRRDVNKNPRLKNNCYTRKNKH